MKHLDRVTPILLLVAGLVSLALTLLAFAVHVPVRDDAHNLVRTASGASVAVPVGPQTYFQKYGFSELLLLGLGLVLVIAVGVALRSRAAQSSNGAGRLAWGLSLACLILGIVGSVTIAPYLLLVGILLVLACGTVPLNTVTLPGDSSGVMSVGTGSTH